MKVVTLVDIATPDGRHITQRAITLKCGKTVCMITTTDHDLHQALSATPMLTFSTRL